MRTGYILFLLGLGLYLIVLGPFLGCPLEDDAAFDNLVDVAHVRGCFLWLMMEEPYMRACHGDAILIAGVDDMVVSYGSSCLCNVFHTTSVCSLDVVAEGEEGIASEADTRVACNPFLSFLVG